HEACKPPLAREHNQVLRLLLDCWPFPTKLMKIGSAEYSIRQAKGMSQFLSEGKGLVAAVQGLSRIAQKPQRKRCIAEAVPPRVLAIHESLRAVLLASVQGNALLGMLTSRSQFSKPQQGHL